MTVDVNSLRQWLPPEMALLISEKNLASLREILKPKAFFFVTRLETKFKKSISTSVHKVRVFSHLIAVDRAFLTVKFSITDSEAKSEYAEGNFDCFIIDANTKRPAKDTSQLPWEYLFKDK